MKEIRELIGQGKLDKAIEELLKMKTDRSDMIIQIQGQLSALKNKEIMGIIGNNDANIERNGIAFSLLRITSKIEEKTQKDPTNIHISDNEGLEKVIGRNGLTRIDWLAKGVEKAKSVCKIHTSDGYVGTGFLVAGDYIYTNNHVINSASIAQYSRVEFGYDNPGTPSVSYDLDHSDFITSIDLDYTRVKVINNVDFPLRNWGTLEISQNQPNPNDALIIIQHPSGRPKEIAFSDSENSTWEHRLHYKVTTQPGSSGSPVFDINWNVVALHHAGGNLKINAQGDVKYVNEGILFKYILENIPENRISDTSNPKTSNPPSEKKYSKPIKTMLVYQSLDNTYIDELSSHMFSYIRNGNVEFFDIQNDIPPQENKDTTLTQQLQETDIVLVFISNNLYKNETRKIALEVEECVGKKIVIPIKISPFKLEGTPFAKLVGLPRKQSIKESSNMDSAFVEIAEAISKVIDNLLGN